MSKPAHFDPLKQIVSLLNETHQVIEHQNPTIILSVSEDQATEIDMAAAHYDAPTEFIAKMFLSKGMNYYLNNPSSFNQDYDALCEKI